MDVLQLKAVTTIFDLFFSHFFHIFPGFVAERMGFLVVVAC